MNLKQTFCTLALAALFTTVTPLLAHQEPTEAAAQYDLADSYYMGKGVAQDAIEAVYWYRKAAKQGHAAAQSKLGWMYQNGLGVQSDTNMAIYWYNKAAEQGYAEALGVVCGRGRNPTLRLWPTIFSGKIDVFPGDRRSRLISSMTSVAPA